MRLFDRATGKIDPAVARAWERYDISLTLRRSWKTLGPKLRGKIHVYCGLKDTYRLEGAVRLLKEDLKELGSDAEVILVEGRDHGNLGQPHTELWPQGMMERIHREMRERYRMRDWVSPAHSGPEATLARAAGSASASTPSFE